MAAPAAATYTGKRLPLWKPGAIAVAVYIGLFLLYAVVLRNLDVPVLAWFNIPNLD